MLTNLELCPQLETDRLLLRLPNESDFEALAAMYADEEVMKFLGGPTPRDTTWRTLATFIGHWCLRGYGLFSVIEKESHNFIGRVGLINPEGWPALEIGWAICRPAWGKGYASEAARAVFDHEIPRLNPSRLISLVDHQNEASIRVAEKLDGKNCGTTTFNDSPTYVFAYGLPNAPLANPAD